MWPLTIYNIPLSKVDKLEGLVSSFAKKWLSLPRCITNTALYGKGVLELPVSSLTEEFKSSKVRLEMTLAESRDPVVAQTIRKWSSAAATEQEMAALKHQEIMGYMQLGRGGLGTGESRPSWLKATPSQR